MSRETISNRYLVERRLGSGSAAEVLLAADTILHRQVAIKRLHGWLSADREARTRFQQEAQAFARLAHPHIVALFDVGEDHDRPYLVMEYLEGETLREVVDHEGPFHPDDVAVVIEHIGEALDYAHKRGVVHRDIKPENILVDRHGMVKVGDFGIAKVLEDATITQAGLAPGTARYISPEQAQGLAVTPASDIYSLGVIAYEMLAGKPPFSGDSAVAVATQHVNDPPASPSAVNPLVPPAVSAVVLRALAKDPAKRYQTAGHFATAISEWRDAPEGVPSAFPGPDQQTVSIPTQEPRADQTVAFPNVGPPAPAASRTDHQPAPTVAGTQSQSAAHDRGLRRILSAAAVGIVAMVAAGVLYWQFGTPGASPDLTPTARSVSSTTEEAAPTPTIAAEAPTATTAAEQAVAPGLIGQTLEQARSVEGITVTVTQERPDSTYPEGTIIEQFPAPGDPMETDEIQVVVSTGAPTASIAELDLIGEPVDEAIEQLVALGFTVQREQVGSESIPEGSVADVTPDEGVPGEDVVTVFESMGDLVRIPPDLQGQPLTGVETQLQSLGLVVGDPIPVSAERIESFDIDLSEAGIEDGDVVGIQEEGLGFGAWVSADSTVTLVYYDASLDDG